MAACSHRPDLCSNLNTIVHLANILHVLMWQSLLGPEEISVIFLEAAAVETLSGPCSVQERKNHSTP